MLISALLFFLLGVALFLWATASGKVLIALIKKERPKVYEKYFSALNGSYYYWIFIFSKAEFGRENFSDEILRLRTCVAKKYKASLLCVLTFAMLLLVSTIITSQ
ncbi:hypothetical protein [Microbulbifer variabilis]|uniref:hypothetical protein n=1 Tax=Microbulbifer variabilis TaxID=266805 RepID=UPI001CFF138C|nr:hypothetical protein [Microbulbifer variabilis]